jgi:hypothetical protein
MVGRTAPAVMQSLSSPRLGDLISTGATVLLVITYYVPGTVCDDGWDRAWRYVSEYHIKIAFIILNGRFRPREPADGVPFEACNEMIAPRR